jgi:hypothetical protein
MSIEYKYIRCPSCESRVRLTLTHVVYFEDSGKDQYIRECPFCYSSLYISRWQKLITQPKWDDLAIPFVLIRRKSNN